MDEVNLYLCRQVQLVTKMKLRHNTAISFATLRIALRDSSLDCTHVKRLK